MYPQNFNYRKQYRSRASWRKAYGDKKYIRKYPLYRPRIRAQPIVQYYNASWNQTVEFTSAAVTNYVWRLTSPYDPDVATGGTSAATFGIYKDLYFFHHVYRVDVHCQFVNKDDIQQVLTVAAYPTNNYDPASRLETRDQNNSDSIIVPTINGGGVLEKKYVFYPNQLFGVSRDFYMERPEYGCNANDNPSRAIFFEIISQAADAAATNFSVVVRMNMYIKASEYKANLAQNTV